MVNEKERLMQGRQSDREIILPTTDETTLPSSSRPVLKNRTAEPRDPELRKPGTDVMQVFQQLTREQVVEGVLLSEILGKPLALRKRVHRS